MFSFQGTSPAERGGYNREALRAVGVDCPEGPPVPIPNTEVKLRFVDDSMRATACENR